MNINLTATNHPVEELKIAMTVNLTATNHPMEEYGRFPVRGMMKSWTAARNGESGPIGYVHSGLLLLLPPRNFFLSPLLGLGVPSLEFCVMSQDFICYSALRAILHMEISMYESLGPGSCSAVFG